MYRDVDHERKNKAVPGYDRRWSKLKSTPRDTFIAKLENARKRGKTTRRLLKKNGEPEKQIEEERRQRKKEAEEEEIRLLKCGKLKKHQKKAAGREIRKVLEERSRGSPEAELAQL